MIRPRYNTLVELPAANWSKSRKRAWQAQKDGSGAIRSSIPSLLILQADELVREGPKVAKRVPATLLGGELL